MKLKLKSKEATFKILINHNYEIKEENGVCTAIYHSISGKSFGTDWFLMCGKEVYITLDNVGPFSDGTYDGEFKNIPWYEFINEVKKYRNRLPSTFFEPLLKDKLDSLLEED